MRIVVYKDGTFYFQVLLRSKEAGTMERIDHFFSVCEMMANQKTVMTLIIIIIKRAKMLASSNHLPVTLLSRESLYSAIWSWILSLLLLFTLGANSEGLPHYIKSPLKTFPEVSSKTLIGDLIG